MQPLEFESTYHIFNRANGSEKIFIKDENYRFFLEKWKKYIMPIGEILSYCLMPNHFHLLFRVKGIQSINLELPNTKSQSKTFSEISESAEKQSAILDSNNLSKQFSNLFSSYTQSFNKVNNRKGSLFMKNFKRKKIEDDEYLLKLIYYIHFNPVNAGLVQKPEDWKYSSYSAIISQKKTLVKRQDVIELFGDLENFIHCHQGPF